MATIEEQKLHFEAIYLCFMTHLHCEIHMKKKWSGGYIVVLSDPSYDIKAKKIIENRAQHSHI